MAPGKNELMNYKLEELQEWRGEMRLEMEKLQDKVTQLDKKNDKGFSDLGLKLKGINDFMKTYREKDAPRIDRLEQGAVGGAALLLVTLGALVWNIIWGHVKPGA